MNPQRGCYSKKRYPDEATANRYAAQHSWRYETPMAAYPCTDCGGWHLATQRGTDWRVFSDPPKMPRRLLDAQQAARRRRRRMS